MQRRALVVLLSWLVAAPAFAAQPLSAVATITPLGWLLEALGGERLSVRVLVPPGATPHAFEPRPSDLAALAGARLFVAAGGGIDDWVTRLAVAEGPPPLALWDAIGNQSLDRHFWLDPIALRDAVLPTLERTLVQVDPEGAAHYTAARRAFAHELTALDAEIRGLLAGVPRRPLIPTHPGWAAFAARYGVPLLAPVQPKAAEEPTPRTLARLADSARAGGGAAVLVEPQLPPAAAAALAEALGVPAVVADPLGDPRVPERGSYAALLRFDAAAFRQALTGEATP